MFLHYQFQYKVIQLQSEVEEVQDQVVVHLLQELLVQIQFFQQSLLQVVEVVELQEEVV